MKFTPELGLVIGIVCFVGAVLLIIWAAGDPACTGCGVTR